MRLHHVATVQFGKLQKKSHADIMINQKNLIRHFC